MSKTYQSPGHSVTWINDTGSDVANGELVSVGDIVGVATADIANGAEGVLSVDGVHRLEKLAEAIGNGTKVYESATGRITANSDSGNNAYVGTVVNADAASGDAECDVKLNWP